MNLFDFNESFRRMTGESWIDQPDGDFFEKLNRFPHLSERQKDFLSNQLVADWLRETLGLGPDLKGRAQIAQIPLYRPEPSPRRVTPEAVEQATKPLYQQPSETQLKAGVERRVTLKHMPPAPSMTSAPTAPPVATPAPSWRLPNGLIDWTARIAEMEAQDAARKAGLSGLASMGPVATPAPTSPPMGMLGQTSGVTSGMTPWFGSQGDHTLGGSVNRDRLTESPSPNSGFGGSAAFAAQLKGERLEREKLENQKIYIANNSRKTPTLFGATQGQTYYTSPETDENELKIKKIMELINNPIKELSGQIGSKELVLEAIRRVNGTYVTDQPSDPLLTRKMLNKAFGAGFISENLTQVPPYTTKNGKKIYNQDLKRGIAILDWVLFGQYFPSAWPLRTQWKTGDLNVVEYRLNHLNATEKHQLKLVTGLHDILNANENLQSNRNDAMSAKKALDFVIKQNTSSSGLVNEKQLLEDLAFVSVDNPSPGRLYNFGVRVATGFKPSNAAFNLMGGSRIGTVGWRDKYWDKGQQYTYDPVQKKKTLVNQMHHFVGIFILRMNANDPITRFKDSKVHIISEQRPSGKTNTQDLELGKVSVLLADSIKSGKITWAELPEVFYQIIREPK